MERGEEQAAGSTLAEGSQDPVVGNHRVGVGVVGGHGRSVVVVALLLVVHDARGVVVVVVHGGGHALHHVALEHGEQQHDDQVARTSCGSRFRTAPEPPCTLL